MENRVWRRLRILSWTQYGLFLLAFIGLAVGWNFDPRGLILFGIGAVGNVVLVVFAGHIVCDGCHQRFWAGGRFQCVGPEWLASSAMCPYCSRRYTRREERDPTRAR